MEELEVKAEIIGLLKNGILSNYNFDNDTSQEIASNISLDLDQEILSNLNGNTRENVIIGIADEVLESVIFVIDKLKQFNFSEQGFINYFKNNTIQIKDFEYSVDHVRTAW